MNLVYKPTALVLNKGRVAWKTHDNAYILNVKPFDITCSSHLSVFETITQVQRGLTVLLNAKYFHQSGSAQRQADSQLMTLVGPH